MASRAQPSASSAVWPNMTSLGSSANISMTPDGSIGSTLMRYLFVMVLPSFDRRLGLNSTGARAYSRQAEMGESFGHGAADRAWLRVGADVSSPLCEWTEAGV